MNDAVMVSDVGIRNIMVMVDSTTSRSLLLTSGHAPKTVNVELPLKAGHLGLTKPTEGRKDAIESAVIDRIEQLYHQQADNLLWQHLGDEFIFLVYPKASAMRLP